MGIILQILTLLGAVTLFLFGLNLFSNRLQKVAGDGMRRILAAMTSNHNYQTGVYYMDSVAELERMGDFIINLSEEIIVENTN